MLWTNLPSLSKILARGAALPAPTPVCPEADVISGRGQSENGKAAQTVPRSPNGNSTGRDVPFVLAAERGDGRH